MLSTSLNRVLIDGDEVPAGELYSCSSKVDDETRFGFLLHILRCLDVFVCLRRFAGDCLMLGFSGLLGPRS